MGPLKLFGGPQYHICILRISSEWWGYSMMWPSPLGKSWVVDLVCRPLDQELIFLNKSTLKLPFSEEKNPMPHNGRCNISYHARRDAWALNEEK